MLSRAGRAFLLRGVSHGPKRSMLPKCRYMSDYPPHTVVGLPALSPTMTHGNLAKWSKKEGEAFAAGDSICEIETDKATVDFEAQDEGFVAKILVKESTSDIPVGSPIFVMVEDAASVAAFASFSVSAPAVAPKAEAAAAPAPAPPAPTPTPAPKAATPPPPAPTPKVEVAAPVAGPAAPASPIPDSSYAYKRWGNLSRDGPLSKRPHSVGAKLMSRAEGKRSRRREEEEDDNGLDALLNASEEYVPYVLLKQRKMGGGAAQIDSSEVTRADDETGRTTDEEAEQTEKPTEVKPAAKKTLLDIKEEMKKRHETMDAKSIKLEQQKVEEQRILLEANQVQTNALQSVSEKAHGVKYTESIKTGWVPPNYVRNMTEEHAEKIRKKFSIICDGEDPPNPIDRFKDMRFPAPILDACTAKGIKTPTPIQAQGLPVLLSGRDMIGIAFTGSGKTLTFSLPLIMLSLDEENKMPLEGGEGPVGIILCPARELAGQTYEVIEQFCEALAKGGYPRIRPMLCIGGQDKRQQIDFVKANGVHIIVATPGRLKDLLQAKKINLKLCRYFCLDEADRMLDLGFDEEVAEIMNHFTQQRQTLLFSATMPQKIQDFAKTVLVRPILVNVSRAGAANLDVVQEVEYVKREARLVYLLQCLQKTAPPVIIFCESKRDVDSIHEYLLLKGVEAVSIHGSKEQSDRDEAIREFKSGMRDVLVATDVAAKGLDFPNIEHVINFDMPQEIENYVHRIGRTGRCGRTGVATTFINNEVEQSTLLDLKHLLVEAEQRVPPCLEVLEDPDDDLAGTIDGVRGCAFCGGLGHRITDCPKIDKDARRINAGHRDMLVGSGGYGGEY